MIEFPKYNVSVLYDFWPKALATKMESKNLIFCM